MHIKTRQFIEQTDKQWTGYAMLLSYRFANLCIKAEEMSLLPFMIEIEGSTMKLEQVAKVTKPEWNQLVIYPCDEDILVNIVTAVTQVHPEFKQNIKRMLLLNGVDTGNVLELTMPEVNKDRHNALVNATKVQYNECKTNIEKVFQKALGEVSKYPEDITELKKDLYDKHDKYIEMVDKIYEDKKKEIEEAYQKYQQEQAQTSEARDAEDEEVTQSMQFPFKK